MRHGELTGICNTFATSIALINPKTAILQGLRRNGIYLCEFDAPRNRKFYVKVVGE